MLDPAWIERMTRLAKIAAESAYCPHSMFRVGACVLTATGELVAGCNVENASYGLTICAERAAIFNAVSQGVRPGGIRAIAVACPDAQTLDQCLSLMPCGACRQVMTEFMEADASVVVVRVGEFKLGELLPKAFRLQ